MTIRIAFAFAVAFPLATGCHFAERRPPVAVRIIDAETKLAVPGAEVRVWHPQDANIDGAATRTGPDGIARIQSDMKAGSATFLEVKAAGYQSEEIEAEMATEHVVEIWSGPRPTVEFKLPAGFRGSLKAKLKVVEPPVQPGQRIFTVPVQSGDAIEVIGPAVLTHGGGPVFRARFADGTELPDHPAAEQVALRWLRKEGDEQQFIVGTQSDWEAAHAAIVPQAPLARGPAKGSGGKGGGGRGHGGRGMGGMGGGR